jgi:hypothetical protein
MAITNSRHDTKAFTAIGAMPKTPSIAANPAKIFIIVCPAIMFAKSLMERLMGLKRKDNISTGTTNGSKNFGTPLGANIPRKPKPCKNIPNVIINRNTTAARVNVAIIWLVNVNIPGINPTRFPNNINKNIENTKGKYFLPFLPALASIMPSTNVYNISTNACARFGTRLPLLNPTVKIAHIAANATKMAKDEFVNDRSTPPTENLKIGDTAN